MITTHTEWDKSAWACMSGLRAPPDIFFSPIERLTSVLILLLSAVALGNHGPIVLYLVVILLSELLA